MTSAGPGSEVDDLRRAGLRATTPRTAVLTVLRAASPGRGHLSAAEVAAAARASGTSLSTQAVYDSLEALVTAGLAQRIRPASASSAVYEARVGDNHHHLVCRVCGTTSDVDCSLGAAPCLLPEPAALPPGFRLDEAEIVFWGTCATCSSLSPVPPAPSEEP